MVWKDGRPHLRSSSEMRQYKNMVMRPEAEKNFQHVMTNYIGESAVIPHATSGD